ncbi:MAG: hypothetical protein WEC75_09240 [Dehalococcoidia bacterium]
MRRRLILLSAASLLGLVAGLGVFFALDAPGDDRAGAEAAQLPTACDNLIAASERLAREGSGAATSLSGGEVFSADSEQQAIELLSTLLKACDRQLASHSP